MTRRALANDVLVMLDPAVEVLAEEVDECSLLCHMDLGVGMVAPAGEGLLDFVMSLRAQPVRVGTLREQYDDHRLIDEMLASLLVHGFAHVTPPEAPSPGQKLRRVVTLDLEAGASTSEVCELSLGTTATELLLHCSRLSDHSETLRELGDRRARGTLRVHHVVVRTTDAQGDAGIHASLVRLGAAVEIDEIRWPAPEGSVRGLAALARAGVATHAIMAPDSSLLDESIRERCLEWFRRESVSGLCLRLDPSTIREGEITDVLHAVGSLESHLGDVVVLNVPSDEVILGNTEPAGPSVEETDAERRFRLAWLRWRIPLIKALETDNPWSQVPEVEDRFVRSSQDLLPNHPELLLLKPGSSIVDVCGGMGRVARRLAPLVGRDGLVISIEMRRFLTERARRFAYEGKFTNIQCRPGRAERLPLPDGSVDAAINEWTGAIWELGIGPTMLREMVRVVRPGGRIAVTHRLVQLQLNALDRPWVQYEQIYRWVRKAFQHPELTIVSELVWGQIVPSKGGDNASLWLEQYMPRLVNPNNHIFPCDNPDDGPSQADVYLTVIAERTIT